jgi:hypothetical protein
MDTSNQIERKALVATFGSLEKVSKYLNGITAIEKVQKPGSRPWVTIAKRIPAYKLVSTRADSNDPSSEPSIYIRLPYSQLAKLRKFGAIGELHPPTKWHGRMVDEEKILCEPLQHLYDYQSGAADMLEDRLAEIGTAYLEMDTGLGKSRAALELARRCGAPCLIIVPTTGLRDQWADEAAIVLPQHNIAQFNRQKKKTDSGDDTDVVIAVIDSARKFDVDYLSTFGLIIIDEVHEYKTMKRATFMWLLQDVAERAGTSIVGMSATPRVDPSKLDKFPLLMLGGTVKPPVDTVHFYGRIERVRYSARDRTYAIPVLVNGTVNSQLTIGKIVSDPERLAMVAAEAIALLRDGHHVFIFAEHRDYLPLLSDTIATACRCGNIGTVISVPELSILRGGVSTEAASLAQDADVVITTYGYSRRGVSIKPMTAMILATPRRNGLMQIIGRITRRGSDESIERIVIDIVDVGSSLTGQFATRKLVYDEKGWPVNTRNCVSVSVV